MLRAAFPNMIVLFTVEKKKIFLTHFLIGVSLERCQTCFYYASRAHLSIQVTISQWYHSTWMFNCVWKIEYRFILRKRREEKKGSIKPHSDVYTSCILRMSMTSIPGFLISGSWSACTNESLTGSEDVYLHVQWFGIKIWTRTQTDQT